MIGRKINSARQLTVPGGYGRSIDVKKGQFVTVRDIEGGQCRDKVTMIARMSLIIVVSACPMDLNPVGGQGITDLEIIVADTEEEIM